MKEFTGWDFSQLKGRKIEAKLPWNYVKLARQLVKRSESTLDMGTGGGELFSTFGPFKKAVATEGYPPNYIIAKKRLGPLGVKVVDFSGHSVSSMPFGTEFDLVLNRHDAFDAKEVFRILQPGGTFLTQQVDGDNLADLVTAFGRKPGKAKFKETVASIKAAGFSVAKAKQWKGKTEFRDIDALVYFLRAVPWVVENFSGKDKVHLDKLQKKRMIFTETRFLIIARKL